MNRTAQTLWTLLVIPLAWMASLSCWGCHAPEQYALWQPEQPASQTVANFILSIGASPVRWLKIRVWRRRPVFRQWCCPV